MITPDSTNPTPVPTPIEIDMIPIAAATRSPSYSSRRIPYASGNTPLEVPASSRPTISGTNDDETPHSTTPARTTTSTTTSARLRPYISPSRPMIGVATEPLSTNVVRIQVASASEPWIPAASTWTAGTTSVTSTV